MKYYALVDCNNFYASCERVFRPDLEGQAIVVLSNNDGCIIARSAEAKALGIEMGTPYWEISPLLKRHKVKVFSSNYPLYGDLSERVMQILAQYSPEVEVYSIDESFLCFNFHGQSEQQLIDLCAAMRTDVKRCTGIPVSVGIAPSKTLAKLANRIAKKHTETGVYSLITPDARAEWLPKVEVQDIWGIARGYAKRLGFLNIRTAAQFQAANPSLIYRNLGVNGLRLHKEINGKACFDMETPATERKNLMVTRSFRYDVYELAQLEEAVASYTTRLAEKIRKYHMVAAAMSVYLWVNPFRNNRSDGKACFVTSIELPLPTANTNELIHWALLSLRSLYEAGCNYKKAGVMVSELRSDNCVQGNLFVAPDKHLQSRKLTEALDKINLKAGRNVVGFAACGIEKSWSRKAEWESPHYTTKWSDILRVKRDR